MDPRMELAARRLAALDDCIAEVLRALDWTPDPCREGYWTDPANGRSVMASTAVATLRRDVRQAQASAGAGGGP